LQIPFDECFLAQNFFYTLLGANYDAYDPPELPETTNEEIGDIIHSLLEIDSSRRCTPVQFYDKATSFFFRALNNAHLVGVLDICELDELTCCLIMELCDGDLENHIRHHSNDGRLNSANLRVLIDNIARGYKGLFDLKIVHRDIKPQNILIKYISKSKQLSAAKITDFGIARTLDDDGPDLCNVAGTLFYMAPEVGANLLKTCQYDSKVDMWSIGCLLYQCVTGEVRL
ncbi:hypothetical protein COOONC_05053, partial [Cooperia oncophora]